MITACIPTRVKEDMTFKNVVRQASQCRFMLVISEFFSLWFHKPKDFKDESLVVGWINVLLANFSTSFKD